MIDPVVVDADPVAVAVLGGQQALIFVHGVAPSVRCDQNVLLRIPREADREQPDTAVAIQAKEGLVALWHFESVVVAGIGVEFGPVGLPQRARRSGLRIEGERQPLPGRCVKVDPRADAERGRSEQAEDARVRNGFTDVGVDEAQRPAEAEVARFVSPQGVVHPGKAERETGELSSMSSNSSRFRPSLALPVTSSASASTRPRPMSLRATMRTMYFPFFCVVPSKLASTAAAGTGAEPSPMRVQSAGWMRRC